MENEIEAKDVAEQGTSSHREQRLVVPLPCAHCGLPAELRRYQYNTHRVYYACSMPRCSYTYADEVDALKAWNRRVENFAAGGGTAGQSGYTSDSLPPVAITQDDVKEAVLGAFWTFEKSGYTNEEFAEEVMKLLPRHNAGLSHGDESER